ncbi:MAG TPA: hypothetical protein ENL03_04960, partial [Phycisphaerae bacterium]|nr:hypothetical protein [Phycisphaerae bacterium]
PVKCSAGELVDLAGRCELPLMADESLLTIADAKILLDRPGRIWWNVRISTNGGLRRALALENLASENGVRFTIGCMVGESGILSSAQRLLLQVGPVPEFVEGNYGKFLLSDDLFTGRFRMGLGGRLGALDMRGRFTQDPAMERVRRYGAHVATVK